MCGIVGAVSPRNIVPILIEGLQRLEYRGYDSCGVAVHQDGELRRARSTARVAELAANVERGRMSRRHRHRPHPLGHARRAGGAQRASALLATGRGRGASARPRHRRRGRSAGAQRHHREPRRAARRAAGRAATSSTARPTPRSSPTWSTTCTTATCSTPCSAPRRACAAPTRSPCSAATSRTAWSARAQGSPLVLGVGIDDGTARTSWPPTRWRWPASPTRSSTSKKATSSTCSSASTGSAHADAGGAWRTSQREVRTVHAHTGAAELGPYRHYMQKEIFEQPRAIADTLDARAPASRPSCSATARTASSRRSTQVLILACGTSYYSGSIAKYWLESIAKIPTAVEIASEYRYRDSVPNPKTLVVTITQSGETADTLAALKHARSLGMAHTLTICNVATSAMVRECELAYITRAGVEIGVASTKAFTTQLVGLFLLTLALAQARPPDRRRGGGAPEGAAPPAGGGAGGAGARAAGHRLERGLRAQGERALPRPRPALPDRAGGRAQAQGDQLHPRRGLPGRRAQARPAGAGDERDAGGDGRAERRAAGEARRATCRKCARAAASCSCSPTPTRASRPARACT